MRVKTMTRKEARINIPLSALRCISRYPKEKKIICEINITDIKRVNNSKTLDEIINEARLYYALGRFKTFTKANELIAYLKK